MKDVRGILLDVERNTVEIKTLDGSLDDFFEALNCGYVDIVARIIGGRSFYIVRDEALNQWDEPIIYGNLFIANIDESGEIASLDDDDINHIMPYIRPDAYRLYFTMDK